MRDSAVFLHLMFEMRLLNCCCCCTLAPSLGNCPHKVLQERSLDGDTTELLIQPEALLQAGRAATERKGRLC